MVTKDPDEKRQLREALASEYLPQWAANVERLIGDGPFFGGADPQVVDLKISRRHQVAAAVSSITSRLRSGMRIPSCCAFTTRSRRRSRQAYARS